MIVHRLAGCAPVPLASYLKALGVLRVVSEKADPEARGWWTGDTFMLATALDENALVKLFLEDYEPTPLFNPWGARSGFFGGSSEGSSRSLLETIEASEESRLAPFKKTIAEVRSVLADISGGVKDTDREGKRDLTLALKRTVRGRSVHWFEAAMSLVDTGWKGIEQPALFGTGGSEGSGSYTAAFMSALVECLIEHKWDFALKGCLFGEFLEPRHTWAKSFGQFVPSGTGTPWDLLIAFEGACEVRSSVSTRSETGGERWMSSPFFVAPQATGFASAARLDEFALNKGKELPGRGEQWFPLWGRPATLSEVSHLFREGRSIRHRRRARDSWSLSMAMTSLGVAQGVPSFVRFGYLQRNNQATHFAVPLGRVTVADHVSQHVTCLDDLDRWLPGLRRDANSKGAPSRFIMAVRNISNALTAAVQYPNEPSRWQEVLLRLADVEAVQLSGTAFGAGPIPRLRPQWVQTANDSTAEFRLAVAFALQNAGPRPEDRALGGVRRHWLPLKGSRYAVSGKGGQTRLLIGSDQVMNGRSGLDDAIALVSRRLIEAAQVGQRRLPLVAAHGAAASVSDIAAFVAGEVDTDRVVHLARALMAVNARARGGEGGRLSAHGGETPHDAWIAIRLALLPWALPDGRRIGADPAILRRLVAGDASTAVEIARRRLAAAGINTTVRAASVRPATAKRWAAALAFPISERTAADFVRLLDPHSSTKENHR